jgi:hypothetical protein
VSASGSTLSLQDRLRQSLKPLGGTMRIDAFITLIARERSRMAAEQRAAQKAARQAATPEPPPPAAPHAPHVAENVDLEDEVRAFLNRDEVREARKDEVSEYLDLMGKAAFDPDTLPE